ncbi:RNA polymerase sigma factor WhiG [Paractinoplanes abujensis]|uniref:RNA polymerase sigma factor for flagellar operon FliA n=1 Tax=Paractinoplanes abujensis TaxID=882441 RepID=A0A7W7D0Z1_9ACTN|nr:sigma-70 family RNA polymerase sigma factor [Actinoplanes abujensis]MBB4698101.1 RNA polymerase sigma factor for flagellar operon FliA [Actinoplanes abujensis]GID19412.1 RNA polymerase sigma factor WhiG [Actinoplanes abujensis]
MSGATTAADRRRVNRGGEDRRREDRVQDHMPLVGHLVREMLLRVPAHVNRDDLLSAGYAALVHAARGYDENRNVPFARFAAARVRGALLDELRGLDWASRSVRQRARRTDSARQELTAELGRLPTIREVADRLGCSVEDIEHADDDVQRAVVFSLQGFATAGAEDMVTEPSAGPEEMLIMRERLGYLRHAIDALPERLRAVVQGYFFEERPMARIAEELGVTESRVSQLRAEALTLLRDGLNIHLDPALAAQSPAKEGCVARRRAAYYDQIESRGDLRARLALTGPDGMPVAA